MTPPERVPLLIGIAGAGMISRHHLIAWQKCSGATVAAIADPDRSKAEARAEEFGIPAVFDDVEEMLLQSKLGALDIASPVETHKANVQLGAKYQVAILCQKPLAPTLSEAQELRNCAALVPFMVHENWRFRKPYRMAREWIQEGRVGEIRRFAVSTESAGLIAGEDGVAPALQRQPFFRSMRRLMLFEVLIHHLDLARALCGELRVVSARTLHTTPAVPGDDCAVVLLEGGSSIGTVTGDYAVPGRTATSMDRVEVIGDSGRILYENGELKLFSAHELGETRTFSIQDVYQSAFDAAIEHFVEGLLHRTQFETSLEDNLRTFALVEAAYEAAQH